MRSPAAIGVIRGTGNPLLALDLSPNGRTLAVGDARGTVLFFDVATRQRVGPPYKTTGGVTGVRFSGDGRRLAVIGFDPGPSLDLVDARTHELVGRLFADPDLPPHFGNAVFSPDSRVVAADLTSYGRGARSRPRHYIERWNALTGRRLGHARSISANRGGLVGFMAGSTRLVTSSSAERGTNIRDATTLRPIRHWRGGGAPAALSPDGRTLAFGGRDGSVRIVDLRTGKLRVAVGRHDAPVTALRFVPNSRALVSAATDGRLIVWDVKRGTRTETLENPTGGVSGLAIASDGRTAYTAGQSGSVIAWDLAGTRRLGRSFRVPPRKIPGVVGPVGPGVVASPDGETFAVPERTGYADVFDSQTLARTGRVRLSPGAYLSEIAISPDGRTMAATTLDGRLALSDMRTHEPVGPPVTREPLGPPPPGYNGFALAFSGDGRWLAAVDSPASVAIWDAQRRTFLKTLALGRFVRDVSLSWDGTMLAATVAGPGGGPLGVVSVPRLNSIAHVRDGVEAPVGEWGRFSPDGRLLLLGDYAGRARLFDTRTWRPRGQPLVGHTSAVLTVTLSSDGRTLATTSLDGTTRLWDVASGRTIGTPLPGVPDQPVSGAFVDGGRGLVTVYDNGRGYLWDVRPDSWARRACEVAGRTLTRAEWHDVLPERDYAPACPRH